MTAPSTERLLELAARCEREGRQLFPLRQRDGFAYHSTAFLLDEAAAALRSLAEKGEK